MSSLDEQLRALEQQHNKPSPPPATDLDEHLAAIESQFQQKPSQQSSAPIATPKQHEKNDSLSVMLQSLEQDTVSQQLKHSQKNQEICHAIADLIETKRKKRIDTSQNAKAIAAEEKKKREQQKYFRDKAEQWLQALDPISNEGMWFYEFAEAYKSPLDAAMDYLMALE
ncbi:hypothetical protein Lepto7376_1645 [[Leptolyngbya] sp. PCC 7376]|uniref:salt stress protein, Slr1339 family n=1 Tax=[Leptolyngbya] sp. PCC 7376 TaxID=111781 RepID=UPI00029F4BC8|nr:hypothetical protein [[Leptolyngbya] sp. PCC 7376]AFY37979.1 hypothetical protein Lepto7376_1645 [[Leptolyngbya] sp. PCC 7376]